MIVTSQRISDTEVNVDQANYALESNDKTGAFQHCLGPDSVDARTCGHPPLSTRVAQTDAGPAEGEPGQHHLAVAGRDALSTADSAEPPPRARRCASGERIRASSGIGLAKK